MVSHWRFKWLTSYLILLHINIFKRYDDSFQNGGKYCIYGVYYCINYSTGLKHLKALMYKF